ncbi:hypothetical protein [Actinomadura flavalba]|uniref:hypothetical protein n=1 Tax=Actinomadura flavalba TaxID=1120938 RepID=UPI0005248336|nr:hypothetical protein [Actinomadura flavalba]
MPRTDRRDDDPAALLRGAVPFRPASVAEILDNAIAVLRTAPRLTLGFAVPAAAAVQLAAAVATALLLRDDGEAATAVLESAGAQLVLSTLTVVLSALAVLILAGLLAPVLGGAMTGRPRPAWSATVRRTPALLAVASVVVLAALAGLLVPAAPFVAALVAESEPPLIVACGILGVPLGLAAMTWLYVLLVQAVPALVLERRGFGAALARARTLTRRGWWRTFGALLLASLLTLFVAVFLPFLISQVAGAAADPQDGATRIGLVVAALVRIVGWSVALPFDAAVVVLLYLDRRMRREGFDLDLRTRPDADDVGFFRLWRFGIPGRAP